MQFDFSSLDRTCVSNFGLLDHLHGIINTCDTSQRHFSGKKLNADAGPESNLQYTVRGFNVEQFYRLVGNLLVNARHDAATDLSQDSLGTTKRTHQNAFHDSHRL